MNMRNHKIVEAALAARTPGDADAAQDMIAQAVGKRIQRPIGDRWNNQGLLTASGSSYDHKALEPVTNMQDAVLALLASQKHGELSAVPYKSPHEAASDLLGNLDRKERAEFASVTVDDSGDGASKKDVTLVMRDLGCGITPGQVPRTIFQLGASDKNGVDWLQGTFGLGGATTYRNATAAVLITRRHPDLLAEDDEDRIAVAIVQWERTNTTTNAFYLVTSSWQEPGHEADPFSVPASDFSDFEPGTHLALIAYGTEGLGRRSGDERSFDTVFNTRLYRPVLPIKYRNAITRSNRTETLDGLERRFGDNPGDPGTEGYDTLPFAHGGSTYQLPIRFRLFNKPSDDKGSRRRFVAHGHALLVTSNGQVHTHWDSQEFKLRTKLNKLYNRILVVVNVDALPIEVRTEFFTADRAQLVRTAPSIRLEREIAAFLDDWAALQDANRALIREAITGDNNDRPTIAVAERIARALKVKGFASGIDGGGKKGGKTKTPEPLPPENLLDNPTHFEGPEVVEALSGKVKGIYFKLNAKDDFIGRNGRGELRITTDHPDIGPGEITVGHLRSGRIRVSVAVPAGADLGMYEVRAEIPEWPRTSGGLGPAFHWTTKLDVVAEARERTSRGKSGETKGDRGAGRGNLVALVWRTDEEIDEWSPSTVGSIESVPGKELAGQRPEYSALKTIEEEIPTVVLNRTYAPLKAYVHARAVELTDEGKEQARERYAVGTGVALLLLDEQRREDQKKGKATDEAALDSASQAAARAVLSVLPEYDRLAKELDD